MYQKNAPVAWLPVKNVCLTTDKELGVQMTKGPTQNFTRKSKEDSMKKVTDMMSSKPTILLNSIIMVLVLFFFQMMLHTVA